MGEGVGVPRPAAGWPGDKRAGYGGDTVAVADAAARAAEPAGADAAGPEPHEIVIRDEHLEDEHLEDGHIDDGLRARGLDAQQIQEARSKVRAYLELLLRERGVDMTDGACGVLVNVAIRLIEESPKAE